MKNSDIYALATKNWSIMGIVLLLEITRKQVSVLSPPNCKQRNKLIHGVKDYLFYATNSAINGSKLLAKAMINCISLCIFKMNLQIIMLSEKSKIQKSVCCTIPSIWNSRKPNQISNDKQKIKLVPGMGNGRKAGGGVVDCKRSETFLGVLEMFYILTELQYHTFAKSNLVLCSKWVKFAVCKFTSIKHG